MTYNQKYHFNKLLKNTFVIICFLFSLQPILSQISINAYAETGTNAVSEGVYGDLSTQLEGRTGSFSTSVGGLLSFSNAKTNILTAFLFTAANDFELKKNKLHLSGFYLWKPLNDIMHQTNFGLIGEYKTLHFGYKLGLNTRYYSFTKTAILQYGFDENTSTMLWEPLNVMYKISYFSYFGEKLNFEAAITNFDRYFIQQETNPMLLFNLGYKLSSNLKLYSELGYMQAGLLNLHVNAFGVYIRGGAIWQIN